MTLLIEDYGLIGNNSTAALVGRSGSIDWLCFPRFDSAACFAALLGSHENGHWTIEPKNEHPQIKRRYRPGTLVLETEFTTADGTVLIVDCMDRRGDSQDVVRLVRGVRGRVSMQLQLVLRFDYGVLIPWVSTLPDGRLRAVAGANQVVISIPPSVKLYGEELKTRAQFDVCEGEELPFVLTWSHSYNATPQSPDGPTVVANVTRSWEKWSSRHKSDSPYADAVQRSLITLKALTDHKTGGIIAAPTTSLPEGIGGERNWDYRYCWLRDSTFTLYALMEGGFIEEAKAWRDWLLRAVAGSPEQMQIMYGVAGERNLTEYTIPHLPGYEGSSPVRIGNAASEQLQLDVFGEVLDSFYQARRKGLPGLDAGWNLEKALVSHLETIWSDPDDGIWEVRGGRRHFVLSKVMAWVAVDRAVRTMQEFHQDGPLERWIRLRADIHDEVCRLGFSKELGAFVQYFGAKQLDASVLLLPLVGFLPPTDPRIQGTVAAIEKHLMNDGLVARYNTATTEDGVRGTEGKFIPCSFWLADNYILQGRREDAKRLFEHLLTLRNDLGLLSEEYDPTEQRQLGNFPQAFSHLALVNTASNLHPGRDQKSAHHRSSR